MLSKRSARYMNMSHEERVELRREEWRQRCRAAVKLEEEFGEVAWVEAEAAAKTYYDLVSKYRPHARKLTAEDREKAGNRTRISRPPGWYKMIGYLGGKAAVLESSKRKRGAKGRYKGEL